MPDSGSLDLSDATLDKWIGLEHPRTPPHWPECLCLKCAYAEIGRLRNLLEASEGWRVAKQSVVDARRSAEGNEGQDMIG